MSAIKPDGVTWSIAEQIIRDEVTGLTIQFDVRSDGTSRMRISGECLPLGNREIGFDVNGHEADAGAYATSCPAPTWIRDAQ